MSTRKSFDRVCIAVVIFALLVTALFMNGNAFGLSSASRTLGYEDRIFDTSRVHTLAIVIDDWDGFLETCESEEYAACSVVIDNESYKNVGLRAKGNSSLTKVRSMDSQRYSLKIEFDHYEKGKTYHGLDKLCLNNIIQDNTYLKDYLTYRMMDEFGVMAPLCSYIWITVNGEDWGLYLAVEGIEDAFLERNYGNNYGDLYKPDSQSFGGGGPGRGQDFRMSDFLNNFNADSDSDTENSNGTAFPSAPDVSDGMSLPEGLDAMTPPDGFDGTTPPEGFDSMPFPFGNMPEDFSGMPFPGGFGAMAPPDGFGDTFPDGFDGMTPPDNFDGAPPDGFDGDTSAESASRSGRNGGGFGGMRGMGSDDVKLKYSDDDPDSYSNIFDNAKTEVTAADKARLIASLKSLGERENLESVLDIDAVLRYFVVHNYVVSGDSYTGSMVHNYYLYEDGGRLSMIPWDYNLAFGGFQSGDASGSVNDPIDTPLSVSGDGDRPMADWLVQGDAYTEQYHAYFRDFLDSVNLDGMIDEASALIADYVKRDPTAFCTYDEFQTGVTALRTFCDLRTESVRGQLDGAIPTTDDGQSADSSALIDASGLDLSDMGNMNRGGGFGGHDGGGNFGGGGNGGNGGNFRVGNDGGGNFGGGRGNRRGANAANASETAGTAPNVTDTPDAANTAERTPDASKGTETPETSDETAETPNESDGARNRDAFPGGGFGGGNDGNRGDGFGGPDGGGFPGGASSNSLTPETWVLLAASVVVMAVGLFAARFWRRRPVKI